MFSPFPGLEDVRLQIEVEFEPEQWNMESERGEFEKRMAEVRFVVWPGTTLAVPLCSLPDAPKFGVVIPEADVPRNDCFPSLQPWFLEQPSRLTTEVCSPAAVSVFCFSRDKEMVRETLEDVVQNSFWLLDVLHIFDLPELPGETHMVLTKIKPRYFGNYWRYVEHDEEFLQRGTVGSVSGAKRA